MLARGILKMIGSLFEGAHAVIHIFIKDEFDPKDKLKNENSIMILRDKFIKHLCEVLREKNITEISLISWNKDFFLNEENLKLLNEFIEAAELKKVHMNIDCELTLNQIEKLYAAADKLKEKVNIDISKPRPKVAVIQSLPPKKPSTKKPSLYRGGTSTMYKQAYSDLASILNPSHTSTNPIEPPARPATPSPSNWR